MKLNRPRSLAAATALALLTAWTPTAATAQENGELGRMWTFENAPLDYLEAEYGFRPDGAWLDAVRLASLRFGQGCSASFVSPKGLIMTNHHCVRGNIAEVQGENDWVKDGFSSSGHDSEVRIPGLTVQQLIAMELVTDAVHAGVTAEDDEESAQEKRELNKQRIVEEAQQKHPGHTAEVVELFQGARYQCYIYKIFDDIRLVVAPHLQAAHFGGDFDNFTYPRFGIDFSFCRAYENDQPADTSSHYFRWSEVGPEKNGLVFLTGNPGSTNRLLTKAQFEAERDGAHHRVLQMLDNRLEILQDVVESDPRMEKRLRTTILNWQNGQKAYRGELGGLRDSKLMARKVAAEAAFRRRIMDDEKLRAKYGHVWDELADVAAMQSALEGPFNFQTGGGSAHIEKALAVVRAVTAAQRGAEDAGQMADFALNMPVRVQPIGREFVVDHLVRAQDWLPRHDPYLRLLLDGRSPREAVAWLETSKVSNRDFIADLLAGGMAKVLASEDPAIRVARAIAPRIEANKSASQELAARAAALGTEIGRALFEAYGDDVSPDATFTLRLSDGIAKGYDYNGTLAPWRTTLYGMFARDAEFGGKYPFDMPALWKERLGRLDLTTPVNFVATLDSTGGNSGSPVINKDREIVGLLFDGNIESLPNEFLFDESNGRSVCVHVAVILEALRKVYDAEWVADELIAGRASAAK